MAAIQSLDIQQKLALTITKVLASIKLTLKLILKF